MKGFIHAGKAFMSGNTLCAWKDTGTSSGKDSIRGKQLQDIYWKLHLNMKGLCDYYLNVLTIKCEVTLYKGIHALTVLMQWCERNCTTSAVRF
jgi:hypothetical protein